jgi:dTDP-4-amino-4,6-dideoxygalactose transaminase
VSSGTAALTCALVGLGIGPGDEVIVPGFTFVASALAVLSVGAMPVVAEVDDSLTLDVEDARRRVTERTRVLMPVHMSGLACDMAAVQALAGERGLLVVEDAAQCIGGSYRGRRVGTLGDAGCFSFNHYKTLACGEGGALVTPHVRVRDRAEVYHHPGVSERRPELEVFAGVNLRFNELLAALMRVQLQRLDPWLERMKELRARWLPELERLGLPHVPLHDAAGGTASHLFLRLGSAERAARFAELAAEEGLGAYRPIDTGPHVYHRWQAVVERRGGPTAGWDPFRHPANAKAVPTRPDSCPRTLELTASTVAIMLVPCSDARAARMLDGIGRAAQRLAHG